MKPKQASEQPTMMKRMMSTSFPILVDLHSYWLVILLVMATMLNKNLICYAEGENTCQHIGCGSAYNKRRDCQCNDRCHEYRNCCRDYLGLCATCRQIGCGSEYYHPRICQCNDRCHEYRICCRDYNVTCAFNEQTTENRSLLQSTTAESTKEAFNEQTTENRSLMQSTTAESTKEGSRPNTVTVVLPVAAGLVVLVSLTVLFVCFIVRRKRSSSTTVEHCEERHYSEIRTPEEVPDVIIQYHRRIENSGFVTSPQNEQEGVDVVYERKIIPDTDLEHGTSFPAPTKSQSQFYFTTVSQ